MEEIDRKHIRLCIADGGCDGPQIYAYIDYNFLIEAKELPDDVLELDYMFSFTDIIKEALSEDNDWIPKEEREADKKALREIRDVLNNTDLD